LAKAEQKDVPPLERLRFLTYCSRNLDEFFMVRAGALRDLLDAGIAELSPDGLSPAEQMKLVRETAGLLLADMYRCLNGQIFPLLQEKGIEVRSFRDLGAEQQRTMRDYFQREVAPQLTPLAVDPGHPFPFVSNMSLNIAAIVEGKQSAAHVVMVKIPPMLPRLFSVDATTFLPIGSLIMANMTSWFPTVKVSRAVMFRAIRNSEITLDEDEVEDLRASVEAELRRRERRQVVCLEIDARAGDDLVAFLAEGTKTRKEDIYRVEGFLRISDLAEICDRAPGAPLRYREFSPRLPHQLSAAVDIFSVIREGDVLLHRPYDSFTAIVEFLHVAAGDPAVVAIKQTLYQTDEDSPIVDKLTMAALNGKQVTVVIELQARFEEKRNIAWARRLHDAGVQVVYGLVGIQTHAKICTVIRREGDQLRQYVHLSTGNYNVDSARAYTDLDLLTADPVTGQEASQLLNMLTGYSARSIAEVFEREGDRPRWSRLVVAPFDYHRWLLRKIGEEAKNARDGRPSGIVAKLNSLVDPQVIEALYAASSAGVKIDLIVRAICCLVPGLSGVSENIRVFSIVDRFLEHSRIIRFENGGNPEVFLSSGDWMPRNFHRRVELTFPLLDPAAKSMAARILEATLHDEGSSWQLAAEGTWLRRPMAGPSSQERFIEMARSESDDDEQGRDGRVAAVESRGDRRLLRGL
jgi:polyphosphate kinase